MPALRSSTPAAAGCFFTALQVKLCFAAERLISILADVDSVDCDIRRGLVVLRRTLVKQREAGTPWRARDAANAANEVLKITIIAFEAGSTTNLEVIDAQRSQRDVEAVVAIAEDSVRQARLDLLVALGRFPK